MTDQFTRPCDGKCGDNSVHDAHLTAAGRAQYLGTGPAKNIFQDSTSVEQLLGELAGFASLCWQEQPATDAIFPKAYHYDIDSNTYEGFDRVFDSGRAALAVEHALARLKELQDPEALTRYPASGEKLF